MTIPRAEPHRLLFELGHQVRSGNPSREPGEVLDLGGHHELAARQHGRRDRLGPPREDQRPKVSPGGVNGRGVTRRSGTDDDDILHV